MASKVININIQSDSNLKGITSTTSALSTLYNKLNTMNRGFDTFNTNLRAYNNSMSGVNSVIKSIFREATEAVIGFTSDAISAYSALETQHAKTLGAMASDYDKTISGQAKLLENGEKLKQQAIDTAKSGSLATVTEVSSAQTALIKSGKSAKQLLQTDASGQTPVNTIVQFAKGNDLDMDTAVDFAVTLGEQFKYKMSDWGEMLDKVSHAADTSVIEVVDIVNSMKYAGGIASGLSRPMEEVLSMLSVMGNAGLKGSIAGTGVQAFFTRMLASGTTITADALDKAPGNSAQAYLDFYTSVMDKDHNLKDMTTVLAELDDAMLDLNDEEQTWFARKVFSLFQMKAAYALTGSSADSENTFTNILADITNNSTGTNATKYNFKLASQSGKIESLKTAWEATKTDIGERMSPLIMSISDEVLTLLQNNGKYDINMTNINSAIEESKNNIAEAYGDDVAEFVSGIATTVVDGGLIGKALLPQIGGIGNAFVKVFNGDIGGAFDDLSDSLSKTNGNIENLPDDLQEMATAIKNVIVALTALAAINTVANVASSAMSIWGATGGLLLGGVSSIVGKAAVTSASATAGMGLYSKLSKIKVNPNGNKLYSGGAGIIDEIFDSGDKSKLTKEVTDAYRKQAKIWGVNGAFVQDGTHTPVTPRNMKSVEAHNKMREIASGYDASDRARLTTLANQDIEARNLAKVVANAKAYEAKKLEIIKKANAENGNDSWLRSKYTEDGAKIIDGNSNTSWFRSKIEKVDNPNVVDYVSPESKIDDIVNEIAKMKRNGSSVEDIATFEKDAMSKLDNVAKDVFDRKKLETIDNAKMVAKSNEEIKAIEETVKAQKALSGTSKNVTTDLKNSAKSLVDHDDKLIKINQLKNDSYGVTKNPSVVSKVVDETKGTVRRTIKVGKGVDGLPSGSTVSSDLLDAAKSVQIDLMKIKTISGASDDVVDAVDAISKNMDDVISNMGNIAKNSASANNTTKAAFTSADDLLNIARSLSKGDAKEALSGFSKKYGISSRNLFDYIADRSASGFSGDDILDRLSAGNASTQKAALEIGDEFGTSSDLTRIKGIISKEIAENEWSSLSKMGRFGKIAGGIGSAGLNIGYGITSGLFQDYVFEKDFASKNGGMSSSDALDKIIKGGTYAEKGLFGFNYGTEKYGYTSDNVPIDKVQGIINGLGTAQGKFSTDASKSAGSGSLYYKNLGVDELGNKVGTETNMVTTYGYIDALVRSMYNQVLEENNIDMSADTLKSATIDMVTAVTTWMADQGITESNMQRNKVYDMNGELSNKMKEWKNSYLNENKNITKNLQAWTNPVSSAYWQSPENKKKSLMTNTLGDLDGSKALNSAFTLKNSIFGISKSDLIKNISNLSALTNANSQTSMKFSPSINVAITMSQSGKVLGKTVTIPEFSGMVNWLTHQTYKVSK